MGQLSATMSYLEALRHRFTEKRASASAQPERMPDLAHHLSNLRDETGGTLAEMEALLNESKRQKEELNSDLARNRRSSEAERATHLQTISDLRQAVMHAQSAVDDATYEKEQSVKQLTAELNAASQALNTTRNERAQMSYGCGVTCRVLGKRVSSITMRCWWSGPRLSSIKARPTGCGKSWLRPPPHPRSSRSRRQTH